MDEQEYPAELFAWRDWDADSDYVLTSYDLSGVDDDQAGRQVARYVLKEVGTFSVKKSVRRQLKKGKR